VWNLFLSSRSGSDGLSRVVTDIPNLSGSYTHGIWLAEEYIAIDAEITCVGTAKAPQQHMFLPTQRCTTPSTSADSLCDMRHASGVHLQQLGLLAIRSAQRLLSLLYS
jgi:hypothetical protein